MSENVSSSQSGWAGDYLESAIVNDHPSWINANNAIWFVDDFDKWVVGYREHLGSSLGGLVAYSQGGLICPFDIDSTTWFFANLNGVWTNAGAGEISTTCSEDQSKSNNYTPTPWLTLLLVLGKSRVRQNSC